MGRGGPASRPAGTVRLRILVRRGFDDRSGGLRRPGCPSHPSVTLDVGEQDGGFYNRSKESDSAQIFTSRFSDRMTYTGNPLSPAPIYPGTTPRFHAMVKPMGAICNLDCTYCYYLHKEQLLGSNSKFRISDEILEAHIRQYIEAPARRRSRVLVAGRRADAAGCRVLREGGRTRKEIPAPGSAHRERPADQRHAAE